MQPCDSVRGVHSSFRLGPGTQTSHSSRSPCARSKAMNRGGGGRGGRGLRLLLGVVAFVVICLNGTCNLCVRKWRRGEEVTSPADRALIRLRHAALTADSALGVRLYGAGTSTTLSVWNAWLKAYTYTRDDVRYVSLSPLCGHGHATTTSLPAPRCLGVLATATFCFLFILAPVDWPGRIAGPIDHTLKAAQRTASHVLGWQTRTCRDGKRRLPTLALCGVLLRLQYSSLGSTIALQTYAAGDAVRTHTGRARGCVSRC
jgi:hypothetical protein